LSPLLPPGALGTGLAPYETDVSPVTIPTGGGEMDATFTAEEHYRQGCERLADGQHGPALEHFRAAYELDGASARYASYYGLGLALVERRFNRAVELCRSAVKEEFFSPDLYHNLARVHLAFGFKAEGIRYLRRGLMIDPADPAIRDQLEDLGCRSRPALEFLPRNHFLNRWLGRVRRQLGLLDVPGEEDEPDSLHAAA
jgi:tetratricopeptide (TPR) repeat protein